MSRFYPISKEASEIISRELSDTPFGSVEKFVEFYNSGLINKKNKEVSEIAEKISKTFQDVNLKGNTFIFLSADELKLEKIQKYLAPWLILVKLIREVKNSIENGAITYETSLAFSRSHSGYLLYETEDGTYTPITNEKFFSDREFEDLLEYLPKGNYNEEILIFSPSDILNLDDSFISKIYNDLFLEG